MISKRIYTAAFSFLLLLSCASRDLHTEDLMQRSNGNKNKHVYSAGNDNAKDHIFSTRWKYGSGLEVREAYGTDGFKYEYKPSQNEIYSFEYLEPPGGSVSSGMDAIAGILEHMAESLLTNLERYDSVENTDRTDIILIPTTFVNIDDIYATTSFGRYCSEQLANYLSFKGIRIVEIRKAENILFNRKSGEYGISRMSDEIVKKYNANSIMVGTYTITPTDVLLNVRMVEADNSSVVRSVTTGQFSRRDNSLVNYLVSKVNTLNANDYEFGESSESEIPNVGITTVDLSE